MKMRRKMLAAVSSLAVLSTVLLAGCGTGTQTSQAPRQEVTLAEATETNAVLTETGILILSVNPEIQIDYDGSGIVTSLTGRNEDGRRIAASCQDEIGKSCQEVLKNLITEIHSAGYFVEDIDGNKKNIVLQIEPGSVLPDDDFLEAMSASTRDAVKGLSLSSNVVTIDRDDYDQNYATAEKPSPYITLEKAQEIALAQANVNAADAVFDDREFDHDDGTAIFELEFTANGVEYEYDIDAVTGKVLKAEHKSLQTGAGTQAGSTDYGATDYGVTDYDDTDYGPNNDGVTDYDDTDYGPNNDGVTDYDDTDYGPNNDGVTDYSVTDYDDGQSNYDDGQSDYDDGQSDYDDGQSDYDDGQSDYD